MHWFLFSYSLIFVGEKNGVEENYDKNICQRN